MCRHWQQQQLVETMKSIQNQLETMDCVPFVSYGYLPCVNDDNDDGSGGNKLDGVETRGAYESCVPLSK